MQVAYLGGDIKKQEERFRESEAGKESMWCVMSVTAYRHGGWILLGPLQSIQFSTRRMGGGGICLWALILH